jgi:hypothetical protein
VNLSGVRQRPGKFDHRRQHLSAMAKRDAKLLEVLIGQTLTHRCVNVIFQQSALRSNATRGNFE